MTNDVAPPILLRASAGSGKTWTARQLCRYLALSNDDDDKSLEISRRHRPIPLFIPAQELARDVQRNSVLHPQATTSAPTTTVKKWWWWQQMRKEPHDHSSPPTRSLIVDYIRTSCYGDEKLIAALTYMFETRMLILIIDGIDEAAEMSRQIERCILEELVEEGHRVVATSRYEGIRIDLYQDFLVLDLMLLTREQQRTVIHHQLGDGNFNEYFERLLAFSGIRDQHDRIYREIFRAEDRVKIEEVPAVSCSTTLLQVDSEGQNLAFHLGPPRSETLRSLDSVVSGLLLDVDACHGDEASIRKRCADAGQAATETAVKLGLAAKKYNTRPSKVWRDVVARTDRLYVISEKLQPVFLRGLNAMLDQVFNNEGLNYEETATTIEAPRKRRVDLVVSPLKNPIRVYEKGRDDYAHLVPRALLPESRVFDVLRVRLICDDAESFIKTTTALGEEWSFDFGDGASSAMNLVRRKNKMRSLDPVHLRLMLCNVLIADADSFTVAEVQVVHRRTLDYNNESHAHDHYDYFRSTLGGRYDSVLKTEIETTVERTFLVFDEVVKVPVLLSLFAVFLREQSLTTPRPGATGLEPLMKMPQSIAELYKLAIKGIIRHSVMTFPQHNEEDVHRCLRTIAYENHINRRRVFTSKDLDAIFEQHDLLLAQVWQTSVLGHPSRRPPLIKVLTAAAKSSESAPGAYQFNHLSLQEYLFLDAIRANGATVNTTKVTSIVTDAFFDNAIQLGSDVLAEHLFHDLDEVSFRNCFAFHRHTRRLCKLVATGRMPCRKLVLSGLPLDDEGLRLLGTGIAKSTTVRHLNLAKTGLDDRGLDILLKTGVLMRLTHLELQGNDIDAMGASTLAKYLKTKNLTMVDLRENLVCSRLKVGHATYVLLPLCWILICRLVYDAPGSETIDRSKDKNRKPFDGETWIIWALLVYLAMPGGATAGSLLRSSCWDARRALRSAAQSRNIALNLWLPLSLDELKEAFLLTWISVGLFPYIVAVRLVVWGAVGCLLDDLRHRLQRLYPPKPPPSHHNPPATTELRRSSAHRAQLRLRVALALAASQTNSKQRYIVAPGPQ